VDTGGTFTDCVAVDPAGRSHQAKVLSSSALRGAVEAQLDARRIRVRVTWEAPPDFVSGFRFRPLGNTDLEREVAHFDPADGVLVLAEPLPGSLEPGTSFEVRSPEWSGGQV